MKVFYINEKYPEKRCVIGKAIGCDYFPLAAASSEYDLKGITEKMQHAFAHRYSRYRGEKTLSCYWLLKRNGVVHTFNSCISGRNEWCATFESVLPRTNYTRMGLPNSKKVDKFTIRQFKLLAKNNCLGCIALSQATYNLQMSALNKMSAYLSAEEIALIQNKTKVLHPPQEILVSEAEIVKKYENTEVLELIFVGHDFFRKGGKELLDCLISIKSQNEDAYKFHLTVVSCMNYGDYASHATKEEMEHYKEVLEKTDWIDFYESLPNEEVLQLCKKAHIGLLPTMADTYGYSVLEMQACGCAMVTTDIRSLPEINNEMSGWICHLPQNEYREALYQTEELRTALKNVLHSELEKQLTLVLDADKKELLSKSISSWERIKKYHNPVNYSKELVNIWSENKNK